ncbi:hypothetical protein TUM4249_37340 [Shewanella sp. KT0246]|nr:hypothetical protein TUM4249_37340 [Shewanella sp. KT0246]
MVPFPAPLGPSIVTTGARSDINSSEKKQSSMKVKKVHQNERAALYNNFDQKTGVFCKFTKQIKTTAVY